MRLAWRGAARRRRTIDPVAPEPRPLASRRPSLSWQSSCLPGGDQRWRWRVGFPKCAHPVIRWTPRWAAWVPACVSVAWALVAVGTLVQWLRRGPLFPLTVMWLGLAGSAALSVALTAVQLFSVIEFTQQTGRSNARPDEVYNYSIDPCQLVELVWPNFLGPAFRHE